MKIAISRMHYPVTTLGPGKRVGLWFQGCSIQCKGCISTDTWARGGNQVDIAEVFNQLNIWLPESDGITITGGEPFDQPGELQQILTHCRIEHSATTFVYSGYTLEQLSKPLQSMEGLIDLLMADPLDISMAQNEPLRGSDNQRLVAFSSTGRAMLEQIKQYSAKLGVLDLCFDGDTAWLAGVPGRGDISQAVERIHEKGVKAKSAEDKRVTYES